jgi:hypothetical protein
MPSETLLCDTSFVWQHWRRPRSPVRYAHWDPTTVDRVEAAFLSISVVTVAETRAGYLRANWGRSRIRTLRKTYGASIRSRFGVAT